MSALRLDRLASIYVFYPLRGWGRNGGIPILMYHSISDNLATEVHPYYRTETSLAVFRQHMAFLHDNQYSVISLQDAWQQLNGARSVSNPVVLTFDDAFQDFYTNAFPVLNQYSFPATVFVPTRYVADTPQRFKGKPALTWGEIRELHRAGIQFGSHTVNHPQLRNLSTQAIDDELLQSKKTIEDKLGWRVASFAYPYAFPQTDRDFKAQLRNSLQKAGYDNGLCTVIGRATRNSDPLFMERLPVNSGDDRRFFAAKLNGAYDWMAKLQYVSKMTRIPAFRTAEATKYFPEVQRPL